MSAPDWLDQVPDRERDALVAERVMGWERKQLTMAGECEREWWCLPSLGGRYMVSEWRPSTSIATAWEVVERMRERGWLFALAIRPDGESAAEFMAPIGPNGAMVHGVARDVLAPTAICTAALRALLARRP